MTSLATASRARLWLNPALRASASWQPDPDFGVDAISEAQQRFARFAPLLANLFPELGAEGRIESPLLPLSDDERHALYGDLPGNFYIKADHALPIAGSIKARGGIHEVLELAEKVAGEHNLLDTGDYTTLASDAARAVFSQYSISVGSTGNLGMSIGIMASALGFTARVHMSSDAKEWKKARLRARGVEVIEHAGDYAAAVASGRDSAANDPKAFFVDDENSRSLFLGYAAAIYHLQEQLRQADIEVGPHAPLFAYLPCGVGGAPAGIASSLKAAFGDDAHCFFVEPVAAACFLTRMQHPSRPGISVYDVGLDNRTDADGLAVPAASELAYEQMRHVLSGVLTVEDETLFADVYRVHQSMGIRLEPSAAAAISGPRMLLSTAEGQRYLRTHGLDGDLAQATHLLWTTGGLFVPDDAFEGFLERGRQAV